MTWWNKASEAVGPRWPWLLVLAGALALAITIGVAGPQFLATGEQPALSQAREPGATRSLAVMAPATGAQTPDTAAVAVAGVQSTPVPTATPAPTPSPTATLAPPAQLAEGLRLHRLGDYMAARDRLAALLAVEGLDRTIRLQARFQLVKSYLADSYYGEALVALEQLDGEFTLALNGEANLTPALDQELGGKAEFLRAVALAGLGRYGEALAAYGRFLDAYPALAAAVEPRIAQTHLALGNSAGAAAAYRAAADAATEVTQQVTLLEALAQSYSNLGRYAEAVAVYDEILGVARNAGYRAQVQYLAGETLALAGDESGAIARWRAATDEAPASDAAYQSLVELVERQAEFDLYQRGIIDLLAEAWLPAVNAFNAYLESVPPDDERADNAMHGLGQSYLGAGNYSAAVDVFDRLLAAYPACDCFGQVWLDKAQAQSGLGDRVGARRIYRTFARDHAGDPMAAEALWRSGLLALNEGNRVEAAVDFLALAEAFPASERAPQALYTVGLGAFLNGLYVESANAFTRLQTDYPDYRWDGVGYWRGRALQATGDAETARTSWQAVVERAPDIYYGVLAAQALQQLGTSGGAMLRNVAAVAGPPSRLDGDDGSQPFAEQWLAEWLQVDPATLGTLPPDIAADPDLAIGRILLDLDERGEALAALERVYERNMNDKQALYALSLEFERLATYRLSLLAMARLLQFSPAGLVENAPSFLQQRAYPLRFEELIVDEATANGIDPLVFFSIIRQESLFEEGARSWAAAQGLAQIIPDTGVWVAERLGYVGYTNALIYRPYINVKFGAYYLNWVRDYLDGNLVSALVGYNAGPGNSEVWRANAGADDTVFVEMVGLNEPRVYVQAIVSNLYHYNRLYGEQ
jgi:soluble lytic murein transglycosylase